MPKEVKLVAYQRGHVWWAKGRVGYKGRAITEYIRESTGASTEAGAEEWIKEREEREIRRHLIGDEASLTFADAVMLYDATPETAGFLIPLVEILGSEPVASITPKRVRDLGPALQPNNSTDTWRRQIITPVRAVINNAHDLGRCPPIMIKGYTTAERVAQDKVRGKKSRVEKTPGSWEWLLAFREHAGPYNSALALFMFATGARIGQAVAMRPDHLNLQEAKACIPAAKGHADTWETIPMELVVELANLPPKIPRGWKRHHRNYRVFGFASRCGPLKGWQTACKRAGIEYLPPHSAGRHGFGQEMHIRQGVDAQAVAAKGRWSDVSLVTKTYTHPEGETDKIQAGFRTGLVQAESSTGLKLLKGKG